MKNKKNIPYIIVGVIIVIFIAALLYSSFSSEEKNAGSLDVIINSELLATFTAEQILALERVEIEKEIVSGSQENQYGTYTGTALHTLLDAADPNWQDGTRYVTVTAEDDFCVNFNADEVIGSDNIMVVALYNGEPLLGRKDGDKGPLRIVVRDDEFGNRSIYWLVRVEVWAPSQ